MENTHDILEQKSKSSSPLRESIEEKPEILSGREEPVKPYIEERYGKKILVFSDPLYSKEKRSIVNYATFRGKWEFELLDNIDEAEPEKCAVKFVPVRDNSNFIIAFKSAKDRVEFMSSIYSDNEMHQEGGGMSLEPLANSNVLRSTSGLIGISVAAYGLYKLLSNKLKENKKQFNEHGEN